MVKSLALDLELSSNLFLDLGPPYDLLSSYFSFFTA